VKEAEKYKDKLRFVHIKDCNNAVLAEARKNKWTFEEAIEHKVFTVIGKGNIDFPGFFRTLIKNGYSGWSVIEQDVKFGTTEIPPKDSVAGSLRYLEGVMGQLGAAAKA
jgi:inosose dehydratase